MHHDIPPSLYRQGYPRGDEYNIAEPMGQIWLWTSIADLLVEQDPTYFTNFWTQPGYIGHDFPEAVNGDLINTTYFWSTDELPPAMFGALPAAAQSFNMTSSSQLMA